MPGPETTAQHADPEGPLEHAARSTAEAAYLARLDDKNRAAWERASGARPERTAKRLLVALSHTIEKAVMSGPIAEPTVVVALFQEMRFFDREREVYERMAAAGIEVVIGFADGAHRTDWAMPEGVEVVTFAADEALADEWSVVAVGPEAGAFLVATDQHTVDPAEHGYQAGRQFTGRWGYSRSQAATELARLRLALGNRLDGAVREVVDGLLARTMSSGSQPSASAGSPGEVWATTSLHHMIEAMRTAAIGTRELRDQLTDAQAAAAARTSATVDPASGLPDRDFLSRWYTPDDTTPLTVGLAMFDIAELGRSAVVDDVRIAYHAAHQVAAALTQPLGAVDAAVRLSTREFLLVVPGASPRHLAALCDAVAEQLELASDGYPGVSLRATISAIVTDTRPLPLGDLHEALGRLGAEEAGPVEAGRTPHGERVVVASSALHARDRHGDHRSDRADRRESARASITPLEPRRPEVDRGVDRGVGRPADRGEPEIDVDPADPLAVMGRPRHDPDGDLPRPRGSSAHHDGGPSTFTELSPRPPQNGRGL